MSSIDNRVVQMTFDNAAFEKKLDETIRSLDTLSASIAKTGQSTGLQDLNESVKKFDMSKMSVGVSGVSKSFLALSTVAVTALSQITKSVISTGTQMVKSLSLDLIMGGFEEYEINMRSIQTILANTAADGTNLQMVNEALDELNEYADLTIYNFAEMARNIGTFTAAGVDLDTSTQAIKGIANLAAISGSNSGQASTAMYQLSQAIASGTVKLMDWNSVVNAGMGGEVFQSALFETGKTLGTLADVPIDQSFSDWTDAGNTFRGSLQDAWITSDVLTTTLKGFTGEMADAELASLGFSAAQIVNIQNMGKIGVEAATKVRTLTQLFDTAKEAVGSGWSLTFRTVIGDFESATVLFTSISNAFGKVIDAQSDKRNALLSDWSDWGGRTFLIESLGKAFGEVGRVLKVVSSAFRDVFPPKTAQDLYLMTLRFKSFVDSIGPKVSKNLSNIKRAVTGLANGFKIFTTFISEAVKFSLEFFGALSSGKSKTALERASDLGEKLTALKESLVDGGGIAAFFDKLRKGIDPVKKKVEELRNKFAEARDIASGMFDKFVIFGQKVLDFFKLGTDAAGAMGDALGRRFAFVSDLLPEFDLSSLLAMGSSIVGKITGFVGNIFKALTQSFQDADYDSAFDVLNTGIFAAIAGGIAKLASGDSLFGGITDTLDELTGVLSAMQADLKANVLLKIAYAIGILAASMLVLSTIDPAALSAALVAMSVGFAQLVTMLVALTKLDFGTGAVKLLAMASTLVILAGAILVMAVAIKIMSTMSLTELATGLGGVAVALGIMIFALEKMPEDAKIIKAAVAIAILSGSMILLATALKIIGSMSLEELYKGFAGLIGGLLAFVLALEVMPTDAQLIKSAAAILILSGSMIVMATAVKLMSSMSWEELAKGLGGIVVVLTALVIALNQMPKDMALKAAGLLALSTALLSMAKVVVMLGGLKFTELIKGIGGLIYILAILAVALMVMQGSIGGAVALGIAAAGIFVLATAIKVMASIGLVDMLVGFVGLAAAITVLAVAANMLYPSLPALILFGVAMLAIGVGVAGIGIGIKGLASGLQTLVRLFGTTGEQLGLIIQVIFGLFDDFAKAMVDSFKVILEQGKKLLPDFFAFMSEFLAGLGELILEYIPILGDIITSLVEELIEIVTTLAPKLYAAGLEMLVGFLTAIRDNVPTIVTLGFDIVTALIDGMAAKIPTLVTAVVGYMVTFIKAIGDARDDIITAGTDTIIAFIEGIGRNALRLVNAGFDTLILFLNGLADSIETHRGEIADAGVNILDALFGGIIEGAEPVLKWFTDLPSTILGWIGVVWDTLTNTGKDLMTGLYNGVISGITAVNDYFGGLPDTVIGWVGEVIETLADTGWRLVSGLYNGIIDFVVEKLRPYIVSLPGIILGWIGKGATMLYSAGRDIVEGLWKGMTSLGGWLADKVKDYAKDFITSPFKSIMGIFSPSRVMAGLGVYVTEGIAVGMLSEASTLTAASESLADSLVDSFQPDVSALKTTLGRVHDILTLEGENMTYSPKITPVLDMDAFNKDATGLNSLIGEQRIAAKGLALGRNTATNPGTSDTAGESGDVTFEQNIYAPQQLSASEIYRQTRNQITFAKEELNVR